MGCLLQAPFAGPKAVLRIWRATPTVSPYRTGASLQPTRRRLVPLEGLPRRRSRSLEDDDAARRVHPPLPAARSAERLPPHPPLRPIRQRQSCRYRQSARAAGCRAAARARTNRSRQSRRASRRALPLSVLWRTHVRYRDLRARIPTQAPAIAATGHHQHRYVMMRDAPPVWPNAALRRRWSCTGSGGALPEQPSAARFKRQLNCSRTPKRGSLGQITPASITLPRVHRQNPGSIKPSPPHKSP